MDDFFAEQDGDDSQPQPQQQQPAAAQAQMDSGDFFASEEQPVATGGGGDAPEVQAQQSASLEPSDANPYDSQQPSGGGDAQTDDIFGDDPGAGGLSNAVDEKADEDDLFSGMDTTDAQQPAGAGDDDDQEPTFLSVWQEQRRQTLEERRTKEREEQQELAASANKDIEKFHQDRLRKIDAAKEQNRVKEKTLREDIQATFEHGTIWEQVGKMVNLQETTGKNKGSVDLERMRALLIHLKNEKKQ